MNQRLNAPRVADVVIVKNGKVLLVQQRKASAYGLWSFPVGRVEDGETLEQAVVREVKDELEASEEFLRGECIIEQARDAFALAR